MVMRLAAALDVPLRQHNALLLAAGFAPVWRETDLAAPELAAGARGARLYAGAAGAFPAVAVDRHWNLLQGQYRRGAPGGVPGRAARAGRRINLADALVGARRAAAAISLNWAEVVRYFIRSVEADAAADGTAETAALLDRLLAYDGVRAALRRRP